MHTYTEFYNHIMGGKSKQNRTIAHNTIARLEGDNIVIRYHNTDICIISPDNTKQLFTGGWYTLTTKQRLNELVTPFTLYQEHNKWYIWDYKTGDKYIYQDGMTINPDNTVSGEGSIKDATKQDKLRNKIKKYCAAYMDKLVSGKIEKPSSGDCFYCAMTEVSSNKPLGEAINDTSHLELHMTEKYYVPSLFYNAIQDFPVSQIALWGLSSLWGDEILDKCDWSLFILKKQGYKSLLRYMLQEFNLPR